MKLIVFPRVRFRNEVIGVFSGELSKYKDILEGYRIGIRRDGVLIALAEDDIVDVVPLVIYEAYRYGFLPVLEKGYTDRDFRENEVYDLIPSKPWALGGIVTKQWDKDFIYYKQKQIVLLARFFNLIKGPHSKDKEKEIIEINRELKRLEQSKLDKT